MSGSIAETPAQKMGLQVGGLYVLSRRPWNTLASVPEANIVMFIRDDTSPSPLFGNKVARDSDDYLDNTSYERLEHLRLYFVNPLNPTHNELILFSLESGWSFEELKEQVEKLKVQQKQLFDEWTE